MRVEEAKYLARKIMEAGEVPLLVGHFGVGKTDLVREIARETGRKLIILVLSQMEPGDLIGLPDRREDRTVFLKPDWWPDEDETIVLLDEVNRSHRSIRNAIMQLLIDRRIHNHILPKGTWLVATMNPPEEEYDQAELITDPAFISRFFVLEVDPDPEEWIEWAKAEGVDTKVLNFIKDYPEFLAERRNVSIRAEIKPSPRSWYKLGKVLSRMNPEDIERFGYTLAAGIVGPEAAKAFFDSFLRSSSIPSVERILFEGVEIGEIGIDDANSIVVRLIDYLSKLGDDGLRRIEANIDAVSKSFSKLVRSLPRESAYAMLRYIVDSSEKGGKFGEVMDAILKNLSEDDEISWLVKEF